MQFSLRMTYSALLLALGVSPVASYAGEAELLQRIEALEKKLAETPRVNKVDGGMRAESAKGDYKFRIGGRIHADYVGADSDEADLGSGTRMRRARVDIRGSLPQSWNYQLVYDFADETIKDALVGYSGFSNTYVQVGQTSEMYSLEEYTSSNHITFMERSMAVDVFTPDRHMGVSSTHWGDSWNLAYGLYGDNSEDATGVNESWGASSRVTFAPRHAAGDVLQFGASGVWRDAGSAESHRVRSRPNSSYTTRLIDTGAIADVKDFNNVALEASMVRGPFSLQAEWNRQSVSRDVGDDLTFDGAYIFGSYFLTGESRPYDVAYGVYSGVTPNNASGAWEVALRYDTLDLDDGDVLGGEMDTVTVGLNWYVNYNLRFMLNLIKADAENGEEKDEPKIAQFRTSIYW